jgi:2-C-methyl-D-erythritol 4-phosphate cytidylyltransferase
MTHLLGVVPVVGRGPLVHGSLSGMPLVERAVALAASVCPTVLVVHADTERVILSARAGLDLVALPEEERVLRHHLQAADLVVIHDPLCPLVPESFVRRLVDNAAGAVMVAVRPVVDTIKATEDGVIAGTVDRERLRVVSSPLVVPAVLLAAVPDLGAALSDLPGLVETLRGQARVELVIAPSVSRRIEDSSSLRLMASVDAVAHRIRERD